MVCFSARAGDSDRLADASDDALGNQGEHRREVEADGHLDVASEALPPLPLPLRVHQASDGEGQVRRHGVAVQTIQLVVRLLAAAEHVRVHYIQTDA